MITGICGQNRLIVKNMLNGETKIYRNDSSLWYIETYENGKLVLSKEYSEDEKLVEEKNLR